MEEKKYTVKLTREELLSARLELEEVAHQHEERAARADALAASGFSPAIYSTAYWRAQAGNIQSVVVKLDAALDGDPDPEA